MTAATSTIAKAERKDWARAAFRGAESVVLPSFTPDYKDLDEEGIRYDVRQSIKNGFFSVFATSVSLKSDEERRRFLEIVVDEAGSGILVSTGAGGGRSVQESIDSLRRAQELGCSHVMFSLPSYANDEDEAYRFAAEAIDSTDLGIVLYIRKSERFALNVPGVIPIEAFSRLAEHPNVIGAKITQVLDPVSTFEVCERLGDTLLLGPVNLELLPFAARICPIQFTAMWQVETCQSPEKPFVVDYLNLLGDNRIDDAVKLYWEFAPLVRLFWEEQAPILARGGHPWVHLKYHQWAVGGNGGLFRPTDEASEQFSPVTAGERARIKETYRAVGIPPRDLDEEFLVGRTSYERGIRRADIAPNPMGALN